MSHVPKCGFIDFNGTLVPYNQWNPTDVGVPQGGPISPTIANMVFRIRRTGAINGIEKAVELEPTLIKKDIIEPYMIFTFIHESGYKISISGCSSIREIQTTLRKKSTPFIEGPFSRTIANHLIIGVCGHSHGWVLIRENSTSQKVQRDNKYYSLLLRFADDSIVFINSEEAKDKVLYQIDRFLKPRGLMLNT